MTNTTTETNFCCIKHLCADNDYNGNPRRVYTLIDEDGYYLAAWNEGYSGHHAVPGEWRRQAYEAHKERISTREYNRIRAEVPSPDYAYEVSGYSHLRMV